MDEILDRERTQSSASRSIAKKIKTGTKKETIVGIQPLESRQPLESHHQLHSIANTFPGAAYQFYSRANGDTGLYYVSKNSFDLLGVEHDADEFFHAFIEHVNEDFRDSLLESIADAIRDVSSWELLIPFIRPDGKKLWLQGYSSPFKTDDEIIFNGILFDVTQQKLIEIEAEKNRQELLTKTHELEKMNRMFQSVLDNIPVRLFWKDKDSLYIGGNQKFCEDAGLNDIDQLPGKSDHDLAWKSQEAEIYRETDKRIIISNIAELGIIETQQRADGSQSWLETNKTPLRDENGDVIGMLGTYQDITDRYQLEQEAAAAAASNHAKSAFLANMSHEIRTPLNGVLGINQALMNTVLNDQQREYCDLISSSAQSLLAIINDILDFSKIEAGMLAINHQSFCFSEMIDNIASESRIKINSKAVLFNIEQSAEIRDFYLGDSIRIRQILSNLISNAVKFTERGHITVKINRIKSDERQELIRFDVIDSGIGIPPDQQHNLFQRFKQLEESSTRQYGGTGLGLAICKELSELMGGEIATLAADQGAHFYFTVPLELGQPYQQDELFEQPLYSSNQSICKVLVVEDNPTNQIVARSLLTQLGHECDIAENGQVAIDRLKSESYDMILMDCQMPLMDGFAATRHIRKDNAFKNSKGIPIIAMTASAMQGDQKRCLRAGMNDYLAKPVALKDLDTTIRKWMS